MHKIKLHTINDIYSVIINYVVTYNIQANIPKLWDFK